ncbi:MAG: SRPBCC domain-containing protein [Polyangiaceae bacterium]
MNTPLERRIEVRCSVAHAFATFTERVDLWWPPSHRRFSDSHLVLEGRVGGRFYERAPSGSEAELGEVLIWEPPQRLRYSWWPGADDRPTEVDVLFRAAGEVTVVEVIHREASSGLGPRWPERVKRFEAGWGAVLPALKRAIEDAIEDGSKA